MLAAVVQSQVLSALRTGHPVIDALLTAALVAAVSALAASGHELLVRAWEGVMRAMGLRRCTVVLNRYDTVQRKYYEEKVVNLDYEALCWHLTKATEDVALRGALSVRFRSDDGEVQRFTPAPMQCLHLSFRGRRLAAWMAHDVLRSENSLRLVNERIVLESSARALGASGAMKLLRAFIAHVRAEHDAHVKSCSWQQRLFRLKRDTENKGQLVWAGALTHSTKSFDTVVLDPRAKRAIVEDYRGFLAAEDWYRTMGLSYKRGYMLHGPPGTGKTSMVLALANEGARDIYSLDLSKLHSDADLDRAFELLPESCVVMLEDVDCMCAATLTRAHTAAGAAGAAGAAAGPPAAEAALAVVVEALVGGCGEGKDSCSLPRGPGGLSLSALLNHLDGAGSNHGRVFVLTTNHPELLDPALVRPGRVDMKVYLGPCSRDQLRQFCELYFSGADELAELLRIAERLPEGALSPAEVSCLFQHHRGTPRRAIEELQKLQSFK